MELIPSRKRFAIVLICDVLKDVVDYLDRVLAMVRGAAQSKLGKFVVGQEGYVLSAAMGSKLSSEDCCQDKSQLNG